MIETGTDSRIRKLKLACDVRLISAPQAAERSVSQPVGCSFVGSFLLIWTFIQRSSIALIMYIPAVFFFFFNRFMYCGINLGHDVIIRKKKVGLSLHQLRTTCIMNMRFTITSLAR